jgi:predicted dehydrogenase
MKIERICLIGYGYWGKILHKNLTQRGYADVKIIDKVLENYHELTDEYDCYFIATPFSDHYKILHQIGSQFKNKRVWCEKPLVDTWERAVDIYDTFKKNKNLLFVDWTYTFNPCIVALKNILKYKKLKQIILNRTNNGPARTDATSIEDLSSHDLSILYYLFGTDETLKFHWNEFSLDESKKTGSNLSWCYKNGVQILINSSWQHDQKNRASIFVTSDDEIIMFDDINKVIINNGKKTDHSKEITPLHIAMLNFFDADNFEFNQRITLKIAETCNSTI